MKATGIVRRVDDLGRIVIPKEIRRTHGIEEGDPLELFVDGRNIIFRKYTPNGLSGEDVLRAALLMAADDAGRDPEDYLSAAREAKKLMEELKPMSDSEAICVLEKAVAQGGTFGFVEKFKIAANNAIEALNRRAAPENKTLTLDQLRQMDGEPVWVVYPTDLSANHWEIIYLVVQQYGANGEPIGDEWVRFTSGASERAADYGKTWLAYARRPEVVP